MKTSVKIIFILSALLVQNVARANCSGDDFEGEFHNGHGDRFLFTQSDCDHLSIQDLQIGDRYTLSTGAYTLQNVPTLTSHLISSVGHNMAVSLRLGEVSGGNPNIRTIFIRVNLPVNASVGIGSTTVEAVATLYTTNDNAYPGWDGPHELMFWVNSIQAIHTPNESVLQKAFIEGVNFGLGLAGNISSKIREYLTTR